MPAGRPDEFWGKLRRSPAGDVEAWHPLVDHCADVAACCEALLDRSIVRSRIARLGGLDDLSQVQVQRLAYLAALHDVGKFNLGFCRRADPSPCERVGHVGELLAILSGVATPERSAILGALEFGDIEAWGAFRLAVAAFAHHGTPVDLRSPPTRPRPALWRKDATLDPIAGIAGLVRAARTWFPDAGQEAAPFPDSPALQHAFAGLVTLADWVGSDETVFTFSNRPDEDRMPWARARARAAVARLWLEPSAARRQLGPAAPAFELIFPGKAPRAAQQKVLELPAHRGGSLVVLEAETGSGKTEAALARFFALFARREVDGLYFALPTRTAAKQIQARVAEALAAAFPDASVRPPVVLAVPGYHRIDDVDGRVAVDEGPRLASFRVLWPDDAGEEQRWRGWAAERPKRFLAGTIVVGTIDQVLLSALGTSHAHLRAVSLLRHLLVVDEVHASDTYMNRLLEEVLDRHLGAGGHALLMSATLGAAARDRFTRAGVDGEATSLDEAERVPYPSLTLCDAQRRRWRVEPVRGEGNPRTVGVELSPIAGDPAAIITRAVAAARAGARVLVLRNTVRDAVATQVALDAVTDAHGLQFRCGDVAAPHHARFAAEDRERLDRAIEQAFGKCAATGRGQVAVATQTVQQSLDLDADLLLTDLCPMDVLLQRLGRLHRHARASRPPGLETPRVIVLTPSGRDLTPAIQANGAARGLHGYGSVYADMRILEATWRLLERHRELVIPAMSRELVERSTHPRALAAVVPADSDRWGAHVRHLTGSRMAQTACAVTNVFRWDQPFGDSAFSRELDALAVTRLGAADRIARFPAPVAGPFGGTIAGVTLPAWSCKGAPEDAEAADVAVSVQGIRFTFGGRGFVYDRLGLRPDNAVPTRDEEVE